MIIRIFACCALLAALSLSNQALAMPHHGHGHGHGNGHWYPQPGPGYGNYPGYGVTCYAQNNWGQVFYGTGYNAFQAQNIAFQFCYSTGAACFAMGCR